MSLDLSTLPMAASVPTEVQRAYAGAQCKASQAEVEKAVDQIAVRMTLALQDADPILLCVMHGGMVFAGMLMRRLVFPLRVGSINIGRYGQEKVGGNIEWQAQDVPDMQGRTVVLIDDVLDQGKTLDALVQWVAQQGAAQVLAAILVVKDVAGRRCDTNPEFVGLHLEDEFLIGCGMDFMGYGRNLPGIYAIPSLDLTISSE